MLSFKTCVLLLCAGLVSSRYFHGSTEDLTNEEGSNENYDYEHVSIEDDPATDAFWDCLIQWWTELSDENCRTPKPSHCFDAYPGYGVTPKSNGDDVETFETNGDFNSLENIYEDGNVGDLWSMLINAINGSGNKGALINLEHWKHLYPENNEEENVIHLHPEHAQYEIVRDALDSVMQKYTDAEDMESSRGDVREEIIVHIGDVLIIIQNNAQVKGFQEMNEEISPFMSQNPKSEVGDIKQREIYLNPDDIEYSKLQNALQAAMPQKLEDYGKRGSRDVLRQTVLHIDKLVVSVNINPKPKKTAEPDDSQPALNQKLQVTTAMSDEECNKTLYSEDDIRYVIEKTFEESESENLKKIFFYSVNETAATLTADLNRFIRIFMEKPKHLNDIVENSINERIYLENELSWFNELAKSYSKLHFFYKKALNNFYELLNASKTIALECEKNHCPMPTPFLNRKKRELTSSGKHCLSIQELESEAHHWVSTMNQDFFKKGQMQIQKDAQDYEEKINNYMNSFKTKAIELFGETMYEVLHLQSELIYAANIVEEMSDNVDHNGLGWIEQDLTEMATITQKISYELSGFENYCKSCNKKQNIEAVSDNTNIEMDEDEFHLIEVTIGKLIVTLNITNQEKFDTVDEELQSIMQQVLKEFYKKLDHEIEAKMGNKRVDPDLLSELIVHIGEVIYIVNIHPKNKTFEENVQGVLQSGVIPKMQVVDEKRGFIRDLFQECIIHIDKASVTINIYSKPEKSEDMQDASHSTVYQKLRVADDNKSFARILGDKFEQNVIHINEVALTINKNPKPRVVFAQMKDASQSVVYQLAKEYYDKLYPELKNQYTSMFSELDKKLATSVDSYLGDLQPLQQDTAKVVNAEIMRLRKIASSVPSLRELEDLTIDVKALKSKIYSLAHYVKLLH